MPTKKEITEIWTTPPGDPDPILGHLGYYYIECTTLDGKPLILKDKSSLHQCMLGWVRHGKPNVINVGRCG